MAESGRSRGIGLFDAFGVAFVSLKLAGLIDWPWLIILSPFWVPLSIFALCTLLNAIVQAIMHRTRT